MKNFIRALSLGMLTSFFCLANAFSQNNPPTFTALCEDVETHAFRSTILADGKKMMGWDDDEKFGGTWSFEYRGGEVMIVDGEPLPVIGSNPNLLLVLGYGDNLYAVSLWSYIVNLHTEEIAASQVNAFGEGIKSRSVQLTCIFSYQ
jgi:hypothetical protein